MKKILGIVGSKRSSGNCEIMVKEISRQVPEPHQLQLLRLPDFDIRYCTGCYRCLIKGRGWVIGDDLSIVLDAIAGADALILARAVVRGKSMWPFHIYGFLGISAIISLVTWEWKCRQDHTLSHWPGNGIHSTPLWEWILFSYLLGLLIWLSRERATQKLETAS